MSTRIPVIKNPDNTKKDPLPSIRCPRSLPDEGMDRCRCYVSTPKVRQCHGSHPVGESFSILLSHLQESGQYSTSHQSISRLHGLKITAFCDLNHRSLFAAVVLFRRMRSYVLPYHLWIGGCLRRFRSAHHTQVPQTFLPSLPLTTILSKPRIGIRRFNQETVLELRASHLGRRTNSGCKVVNSLAVLPAGT